MRMKALALVLGAAMLAPAPSPAQDAPRDFILRGPGATIGCAEWIELRAAADGLFAARKRETYQATIGWALGYLSGAARFGLERDPLRNSDEEATIAWLAEHCRANPGAGFRQALEAFIEARSPR